MSKSASSDQYLISFIKLNFIYLSTAKNNNFILICVKFKSLYCLSQSYRISFKSFLKPMALVLVMIFVMLYCTLDIFLKVYNLLSIFCNSN